MSRLDEQVRVRLPSAVKIWVAEKAKENRRSNNAQVVHMLEELMAADAAKDKKRHR